MALNGCLAFELVRSLNRVTYVDVYSALSLLQTDQTQVFFHLHQIVPQLIDEEAFLLLDVFHILGDDFLFQAQHFLGVPFEAEVLRVSRIFQLVRPYICERPMLFAEFVQVHNLIVVCADLLIDILVYILEVFKNFAASDLRLLEGFLEAVKILVRDGAPVFEDLLGL